MTHLWYEDAGFVRRVQTNLNWYNEHKLPGALEVGLTVAGQQLPERSFPLRVDGVVGGATKDAIKKAKYYLGYADGRIKWGEEVDDAFVNRLHHPTYLMYSWLGERIADIWIERGIRRRDAYRATHSGAGADILTPKIISAGLDVDNLFGALGTPTTLVFHHSQGPRDTSDAHALSLLQGINSYHKSKNWGGIGYHLSIATSGTIFRTRPITWKGVHAPPNTGRIGCVLLGDYRSQTPNDDQVQSMRWVAKYGQPVGVPAGLEVGGHRDYVPTDCPGGLLYAVLPRVRA